MTNRIGMRNGVRYIYSDEQEAARNAEEAAVEAARPSRAFAALRSDRNGKLAKTDWVVAKALEAGEDVPARWVSYRSALRDLPAQYDNSSILSEGITWPVKP